MQKGNFMEVKIELCSEGCVNEVVLGSSQNSFYSWKPFMSHVIQQTNVTRAVPREPGRERTHFDPWEKVHDEGRCYGVL